MKNHETIWVTMGPNTGIAESEKPTITPNGMEAILYTKSSNLKTALILLDNVLLDTKIPYYDSNGVPQANFALEETLGEIRTFLDRTIKGEVND